MGLTKCALASYPSVVRLLIEDSGTADPAIILADCVASTDATILPVRTSLTVQRTQPSAVAFWDLFAVSGARRVPGTNGVMRYRFEDYRHKFKTTIMPRSFNTYDAEGQLDAGSTKSIEELWQEIATATESNITVANVPSDFNPPAAWSGRTATQAANSLLELTGSRMFYNPAETELVVDWAGNTDELILARRRRKELPSTVWNNLEVFSAPTLYDGAVSCNAVWIKDDGDVQNVSALSGDESIGKAFVGYPDVADPVKRNRLVQAALRLWKPLTVSHPSTKAYPDDVALVCHRGVVVGGSADQPIYESIKVYESSTGTSQHSASGFPRGRAPRYEHDAGLIVSDHAIVVIDNAGTLQTGVKFVTAYHIREDGFPNRLKSLKEDRELNPTEDESTTKQVIVPAVRPIDSDQPDGPGDGDWGDLLTSITDAIEPVMKGKGQEVGIPNWIVPANWGRTTSIRWLLQLGRGRQLTTQFEIDSAPAGTLQTIGLMQ